ncbi:hypothetical protein SeMB42_g07073 [Synchytrium endobioticum]|nr:hypothetical protein SeMB42_g07073 [Synchytrium endobioticum]
MNGTSTPKRFHNGSSDVSQDLDMHPEGSPARWESCLKALACRIYQNDASHVATPPRTWLQSQTPSPTVSNTSSSVSSPSASSAILFLSSTPSNSVSINSSNNNRDSFLAFEDVITQARHTKKMKLDLQGRSKGMSPLVTDLGYRQQMIDSPLEQCRTISRSWTPPTPSSPALSTSSSGDSYASASSTALTDLPFEACTLYTEHFQAMEYEREIKTFSKSCPEDVLLCIFRHLDDVSLSRAYRVCRDWGDLIKHYENWLWSHLSRRDWHLTEKTENAVSWKHHYRTHKDLHYGNYQFQSFNTNTLLSDNVGHKPQHTTDMALMTSPRNYVMAWPVDPTDAYIVALAGDEVCFVDVATPDVILVCKVEPISAASSTIVGQQPSVFSDTGAVVDENNNDVVEDINPTTVDVEIHFPVLQPITRLYGHRNAIGLILSNGEGMLVSFDDSSTIMIWDMGRHKFEREIQAFDQLGFIFSMNVHHRFIVTGGRNGKIIVWSADTGDALLSIDIPNKYLEHLNVFNLLNVAMWEEFVAYGLYDGTFYVYDMKQQKELYSFCTLESSDSNSEDDNTATITALAPMTLAINGHVILTNGPRNDQLAAWDVATGKLLYTLSESDALGKRNRLVDIEDDMNDPEGRRGNNQDVGGHAVLHQVTPVVPTQAPPAPQQRSRELKFAEISRDASLIFGSVAHEGQLNMLAWDFRGDKSHTRRIEKRLVQGQGRLIQLWLCFDEL